MSVRGFDEGVGVFDLRLGLKIGLDNSVCGDDNDDASAQPHSQ